MTDILHYYLDLLRNENEDRFGFHNVLNVMKQSRGGYVLNESFDGIDLRNEPLVGIHFSDDDGKNASSFRGCNVNMSCFLSGHSAPIESMEFIDDNTLVSRSANEVITWDIWSGVPIETKVVIPKEEQKPKLIEDQESNKKNKELTRLLFEITQKNDYIPYTLFFVENRVFIAYIPARKETDNAKYFLCDTKTRKLYPCSSGLCKLKNGDSKYVYLNDRNELILYDLSNIESMPISLNIFLPRENHNLCLHTIGNSQCLLATNTDLLNLDLHKNQFINYIVNILDRKIILEISEIIEEPIFLSELDSILILYRNHAELRKTNGVLIMEFPEIKREGILFPKLEPWIKASVSKNKEYIALANYNGGIDICSIISGKKLKNFGETSYSSVTRAIISNDRLLAIVCSDVFSKNCNLIWSIKNNHIIRYAQKEPYEFNACSFSFDSHILAICHDKVNCLKFIYMNDFKTTTSVNLSMGLLQYRADYYRMIGWDYAKNMFLIASTKGMLYAYNSNGKLVYSINLIEKLKVKLSDIKIKFSNKLKYLVITNCELLKPDLHYPHYFQSIIVFNCKTNKTKMMEHNCIYPLDVSDDGKYVTVVTDVDFDKAIIKTQVLDMHEKTIFSEKTIEKDYILLNYLRKQEYTSSGWTIKVPSSPDNSTEALIYLVPNLYIGGCDFRGSTFDDETKEIIRQYNGIV